EARDASGVVLVQAAERVIAGEPFQPRLFRFRRREARHQARQRGGAAARTGHVARARDGPDQETDTTSTVVTFVLVDRHPASILARATRRARPPCPAGGDVTRRRTAPPSAPPTAPSRPPASPACGRR